MGQSSKVKGTIGLENTRREKERADKEKERAEVTESENAALHQRIRELEGKK